MGRDDDDRAELTTDLAGEDPRCEAEETEDDEREEVGNVEVGLLAATCLGCRAAHGNGSWEVVLKGAAAATR